MPPAPEEGGGLFDVACCVWLSEIQLISEADLMSKVLEDKVTCWSIYRAHLSPLCFGL